VIGASIEMRRLYSVLARLARSPSAVLIEGEPGTGKDLVAEMIHEASARAGGPFVVVDCAAPGAAELAFGAGGAFEAAAGGTIVLDQIGALPFAGQASLSQAIRGGGPNAPRILGTARSSLEDEVQAGRFREDLLAVFDAGRVELPPLRRRDGDVRYLAHHLWTQLGGAPDTFPFDLLEHMAAYTWPGNVGELETVLAQRLAGEEPSRAPTQPRAATGQAADVIEETLALDMPLVRARERVVQEFERRYLERALTKQNGNVLRAAAASGVARRYFQILRAKRFR
jgi:DNA-binding NtrC family response regulator